MANHGDTITSPQHHPTPKETTEMTTGAITFQQLGGNRFVAMTGARSLTQDETTFTFRLPNNFANHGINHVRIVLEASDTY